MPPKKFSLNSNCKTTSVFTNRKTYSEEINKLQKAKEKCGKSIEEKKLEIKKIMDNEMETIQRDSHEAARNVKSLLRKHNWINGEKHLFGDVNAGYGFNDRNFNSKDVHSRMTN